MLSISNIYAHGYAPAKIDRLRRLGFKFRERVSRFDGSQILHFIDFARGPALEFIQVEDQGDYLDFVPPGMIAYSPGISILLRQNSSKGMSDIQAATEKWGSYALHVNDDGGDEPDRPGWHYLNFKEAVVKDTFVYVSARIGAQPDQSGSTAHPNTIAGVTALHFDLDDSGLAKLAEVTQIEMAEGAIEVGGVRIGSRRIWKGNIDLPQKQFPLAAIVLQAGNLDTLLDRDGVEMIEYQSKPAVYIQMNELSWDFIVTT